MKKKEMHMNNACILLIAILLAAPHMYAMEMEEYENDKITALPKEIQYGITIKLEGELLDPKIVTEWDIESPIYDVCCSSDGTFVATYHPNDGRVQIHSTHNGHLQNKWIARRWINALVYSPDGKYIATGHEAGGMTIYSIPKGGMHRAWLLKVGTAVEVLDYTLDGKYIAIMYSNGQKELRHTDNNRIIQKRGPSSDPNYIPNLTCWVHKGYKHVDIYHVLPGLAAQECLKKGLTLRQLVFLTQLKHNRINNPLYLNTDGKNTFDSLRGTVNERGERIHGIDDFYTLEKGKSNDAKTDESKKRWRIVKVCNQKRLEELEKL
jgi:hypothetical protein